MGDGSVAAAPRARPLPVPSGCRLTARVPLRILNRPAGRLLDYTAKAVRAGERAADRQCLESQPYSYAEIITDSLWTSIGSACSWLRSIVPTIFGSPVPS
jgi:hypothetical protein